MKARLYLRISEEDRDKPETSIENQKKECMRHALKIDAELDSKLPFYIAMNEKSWKPLKERAVLSAALEDAKAGDYDILIVKDWSRFARGRAREPLEFLFKEANVSVVPVHGATDEIGKDAQSFADSIIIKENRRKARTLLEQKQLDGHPIGRAPFGYKYGKKKVVHGGRHKTISDGRWHINPPEADKVLQAFERKAKGEHWKTICEALRIKRRLFYKLLNNKAYLGRITYKKRIRDPDGAVVRTEDTEYQGTHKPIISQELWDECH